MTATQNDTKQMASQAVAFGLAPQKGPRSFPINLDFSVNNTVQINLNEQKMQDKLEWVQSVYADNSNSSHSLTLTDGVTNQSLTWPAGWQGYLPFISAVQPVFTATIGGSIGVQISILLLTFAVPAHIWPFNGNPSGSIGVDWSVNKPSLAGLNLLQTVPLNAKRRELTVQNQSADTLTLVLDDGAGNNISMIILAAAAVAGGQGGAWSDNFFKGRMRVYSTGATSQVEIREQ